MKCLFLEMLLVSFNMCKTTSIIRSPAQSVNRGLSPSGDIAWAGAHQTAWWFYGFCLWPSQRQGSTLVFRLPPGAELPALHWKYERIREQKKGNFHSGSRSELHLYNTDLSNHLNYEILEPFASLDFESHPSPLALCWLFRFFHDRLWSLVSAWALQTQRASGPAHRLADIRRLLHPQVFHNPLAYSVSYRSDFAVTSAV